MFYVIDLSKPRRYIQGKCDDIILELKLSPPKVNKALIAALAAGVIIAAGTTASAAGSIDQGQYNFLLEHYVKDLNYPRELAEKLIGRLTVTDIEELHSRVQHHKEFVKQVEPILNMTSKGVSKAIEGLKNFMSLYKNI